MVFINIVFVTLHKSNSLNMNHPIDKQNVYEVIKENFPVEFCRLYLFQKVIDWFDVSWVTPTCYEKLPLVLNWFQIGAQIFHSTIPIIRYCALMVQHNLIGEWNPCVFNNLSRHSATIRFKELDSKYPFPVSISLIECPIEYNQLIRS